ncbi:g3954 [Coccomyxa viridis]|uniref:G3954 protein n=1 Tax=Coccomyxa viridis TaxID=1274662 RepID=A0ABP1FU43_9CHLO
MYMPKPPYAAPGSGNALSPSQSAQNNQTLDRFNRTQDTYVIAIAVSCAFAGVVLLAVGGIAATIEMRKYELRAAQAGQAQGQWPVGPGQRAAAGDSASSSAEQEHVISVMVVQPDDTVTIACQLAASPKQHEAQMTPQWQDVERGHNADAQTVEELCRAGSSPAY